MSGGASAGHGQFFYTEFLPELKLLRFGRTRGVLDRDLFQNLSKDGDRQAIARPTAFFKKFADSGKHRVSRSGARGHGSI